MVCIKKQKDGFVNATSKNTLDIKIYCCGCEKDVTARLTNGAEIYPHRKDLNSLPFWKCDSCENYVGCHYKTKNRTRPLGNIPTKEIRNARNQIHSLIDPLWKSKKIKRNHVYEILSNKLGYEYHTAKIKTIDEARRVYIKAIEVLNQFKNENF